MNIEPTSIGQIQLQYELAMSIGTSLDLIPMLRVAVGGFARKLNCAAALVYRCDDGWLDLEQPVYQIPRNLERNRAYQIVKGLIPEDQTPDEVRELCGLLPLIGDDEGLGSHYYILPLEGFGFLALTKEGERLDPQFVRALEPLVEKLAQACNTCLQNEALQQSYRDTSLERNMLRTLIDNTPVIAFAVDADGVFIVSEGHGLSTLGRRPGEAVGHSIFELYSDNQDILDHIHMALAGKRSMTTISLGGLIFDAHYEPVWDQRGQVVGVVGIAHDITARHAAEATLRAVLDTVGEGIIVTDAQGIIVMTNSECSRMLGYEPDAFLNKAVHTLLAPREQPRIIDALHRYREQQDKSFFYRHAETVAQRQDGTVFPAEVRLGETKLSGQSLVTISLRDITRRKELEQMRDEFIANITHELRTPLASIMGWTETLLNGRPGPLTDLQMRFLTINLNSAKRLNALVEQVLYLANIQRNQLQLECESFSPHDTLQQVLQQLQARAADKSVELDIRNEWSRSQLFVADAPRLEQVLSHLIDNAIKFSKPNSTVCVTSVYQDHTWVVTVADDGIGIPPREQAHLFQRFHRCSNARSAEIQGAGLGLYISKTIVDAHGGELVVESALEQGATVTMRIPEQTSAAAAGH